MEKIKIGRVTGAQGLRGEMRIFHDSGDDDALKRVSSLFLCSGGVFEEFAVEGLRMQKRTPVLKLAGVEDRTTAEAKIGAEVYALLDEAKPDEDGAWLVSDLVGLDVKIAGEGGGKDGKILNVISNPAHDLLEIGTGEGVLLLPFVDVFIREVDMKAGVLTIDPPAGWAD